MHLRLNRHLMRPRKTVVQTIRCVRRQWALRLVLMETTQPFSSTLSCIWWSPQTLHQRMIHLHCIFSDFPSYSCSIRLHADLINSPPQHQSALSHFSPVVSVRPRQCPSKHGSTSVIEPLYAFTSDYEATPQASLARFSGRSNISSNLCTPEPLQSGFQ